MNLLFPHLPHNETEYCEYDPEKEYNNITQKNEVYHQRQPRMVAYALFFRAIMPVSYIERYLRKNYLIFEETCFSVKKR